MKKEEKEPIENLFGKNNEIIENLNLEKELKNQLLNLNRSLYNIAINNILIPISIYLENIEQDITNIIIENILRIIAEYEVNTNKPNYIKEQYYSIRENDLMVASNYNLCEELFITKRLKNEVRYKNSCLIMANENKYDKDFFNDKDFDNRITFHLIGPDYTDEEIIRKLKEKLENNYIKNKIKDSEWLEIIKDTLNKNKCYRSNCADYLYKKALNEKIIKNNDEIARSCLKPLKIEPKETINLEDLIGLENVKKEINSLKNYLAMQKRIGNILKSNYLNMLFLGNPGTGKTTVGRIYASILYELGFIKENKVIEIIPTDLMANYVGQTKDQTRKILNKAKGGVLFIDEAYLIANITYSDGFASFMSEAVIELMKYMEDPKNVVIFAGYPIETRKIYDSNPGMKSRICKEIIFADYNTDELYNILKNNLKKYGFKINNKAKSCLKKIIMKESQKKNFGNARFCNVLMQQLLMNYANHNLEKDTYEIKEEDTKLEDENIFQIGFMEG